MKWLRKKKSLKPLPTIFMEYKARDVDLIHNIIFFSSHKEFIKFLNGKFRQCDIVRLNDGSLFTMVNEGLKVYCTDESGNVGKKSFKKLITG